MEQDEITTQGLYLFCPMDRNIDSQVELTSVLAPNDTSCYCQIVTNKFDHNEIKFESVTGIHSFIRMFYRS